VGVFWLAVLLSSFVWFFGVGGAPPPPPQRRRDAHATDTNGAQLRFFRAATNKWPRYLVYLGNGTFLQLSLQPG
jgi:hypothetical protein